MMVIGGIIGAGIFLNPAIVAERVGTASLTLAAWILGGLIALAGALCYGELGARIPRAGGGYVYLREAFGGLSAFLYGWTLLLVINTGAIAAVAVIFAQYAADLFRFPSGIVAPLAAAAIVLLSGINYLGIKPGSVTQNILTTLKLAALTALILTGLLTGGQTALPAGPALPPSPAAESIDIFVALGAALVPVLFAYGGWQNTNFLAEEIINPERKLPRALLIGVAAVVAVYLLANAVYLRTLSVGGLAGSRAPASETMRALIGPPGGAVIAAGIMISTFGFLNMVILAAPRVYHAMAADGLFFQTAARLHPRYRTPGGAIVFQAAWAIALMLTRSYSQLLDYVVFGDWIFFGLTAATLFVFRRREAGPGLDPPPPGAFRAGGYPWTPALFCLAALYVVASSVGSNPGNALRGGLLISLGVPVYFFWKGRSR